MIGCSNRKPVQISYSDSTHLARNQQLANESSMPTLVDSISYAKNRIWIVADSMTLRLPPSAFYLPDSIISYLEINGYTVPQIWFNAKPHNVISGSFSKPGQLDWAVLASKDRISSIMIFWNGSIHDITEIKKMPDKNFLQGVLQDSIGYSRCISKADTSVIFGYQRMWKNYATEYGVDYGNDIDITMIDHDGIEEAFIEKASGIHYLYNNTWMEFSGSD